MTRISGDKRRFLNALLISALFHGILIVVLGFWTLNLPSLPELPPVLSVTITPEVAVIKSTEAESIPENPHPNEVEKKKVKESVPVKEKVVKQIPAAVPVQPAAEKKVVSSAAAVPGERPESASRTETSAAWDMNIDEKSTVPLPSPSGSEIVYDDDTDDSGSEQLSVPENMHEPVQNKTLTGDELDALASVLDTSTDNRGDVRSVDNAAEQVSVSDDSLIPEDADLDLGNSTRKPKYPLDLEIPKDLLSEMDHDGFITVEFTLTPEGRIMDPKVINSSVNNEIGAEVKKALRNWEFTTDSGASGTITGEITIRFKVR